MTTCQGIRSLILPLWQVANHNGWSSNYFCNRSTFILFIFHSSKVHCSEGTFFVSLCLLSLLFSTCSSPVKLCLSDIYMRLWRLVEACVNKFISLVQIYHYFHFNTSRKRRKTTIIFRILCSRREMWISHCEMSQKCLYISAVVSSNNVLITPQQWRHCAARWFLVSCSPIAVFCIWWLFIRFKLQWN